MSSPGAGAGVAGHPSCALPVPQMSSSVVSAPLTASSPRTQEPLPDGVPGFRANLAAADAAGAMGARSGVASTRPRLVEGLPCTCPMVCMAGTTDAGYPSARPLEVTSLQLHVHCHINQAFVDMQLLCNYPATWPDAALALLLPKTSDTTITELSIRNELRGVMFATTVVPAEDLFKYEPKGGGGPHWQEGAAALNPEMFMLPMPPGVHGDCYRVTVSYFHPMPFDMDHGTYVLQLPTKIPQLCLFGRSINSVLEVSVTINTDKDSPVELAMPSHPYVVLDNQPGQISIELDGSQAWPNEDFIAGYRVWRDSLTATVRVEAPHPDQATGNAGTFALCITPPGPEDSVAFPRSVVFMFDRSGSMTGDPIRYAKAALLTGLHSLTPADRFTVVAFDHEQMWWTDGLIEAAPQNIARCTQWVNEDLSARGATDFKSPLQLALRLLTGAPGLPLVFLLTDGCVGDDERDICHMADAMIKGTTDNMGVPLSQGSLSQGSSAGLQNPHQPGCGGPPQRPASSDGSGAGLAPRVYTFGIGPYCNHFFLKCLAVIGRGLSDFALRTCAIRPVMERMLAAAALPILSDVTLCVAGLTSLTLYPCPIPDVFVGQPLLVSGQFEGHWPESVEVKGILADGTAWAQEIPTLPADTLPLVKMFGKGQLDQKVAEAWLQNFPLAQVQDIVGRSMATGIATPFTTRVGFVISSAPYEEFKVATPQERRERVAKWAISGVCACRCHAGGARGAGVAVVAGVAAALAFGDQASTMANLPVTDDAAVGDVMLGGLDLGGFGNCGDCGPGCDCCYDYCGYCCSY